MIQIKRKTLNQIKLILNAQYVTFSKPEMIKKVPFKDKPIMALQRKMLGNLVKEIDELLEE